MAQAGTVEGAKKTTVYIKDELYRELRLAAIDGDTSMNKIVEQGIRDQLEKRKTRKK